MEKLDYKIITTKKETELVLDKIENYSGVRLPLDYANRSKIVGVFLHNQLAACYMLVSKPDFRSLFFVPDNIKKENKFFNNDSYEMMEVNGLWIGPALKKPSTQVRVWLHLVKDIFMCRKRFVLLMQNSRNKSMDRFMNMAKLNSIYAGPPLLRSGEQTHNSIKVSYTTRWSILLNTHKYILELRQRQQRAQNFAKKQEDLRALKQSGTEFA